jgi:hypothetical protein
VSDVFLPMSATIALPSGSPSSVNLHDRTKFELIEWNRPGVEWRVDELEGENQPGAIPLKRIRARAVLTGAVVVLGSSEATLRTNESLLYRALDGFNFSLVEVIDGNSHTYTRCQTQAIVPRGDADWDFLRAAYRQEHTFTIRCHPRTVGTP